MDDTCKNQLKALSVISGQIDELKGHVADDAPSAVTEPLRAEARGLVLRIIDALQAHIAELTDALLDGENPKSQVNVYLRELDSAMELFRPREPIFWPDYDFTADAIENDRRLFRKAIELDPPPEGAKLLRKWLRDSERLLARLEAGTLYDLGEVDSLSDDAKDLKRLVL